MKSISVEEVEEILSRYMEGISSGLDDLTNELYFHRYDLFAPILAAVYYTRQQTGCIPNRMSQGMVLFLGKDSNNGNVIENFRPSFLLNTALNILVRTLVKKLVLVAGSLVGDAQTCTIHSRATYDNLHPCNIS